MTTKIFVNNLERKLFFLLAGFLGVAVFLYFYSVISLTLSAVARDRTLALVRERGVVVSAKEREYIQLQNGMTRERAQELGFAEVSVKFAGETVDKLSFAR